VPVETEHTVTLSLVEKTSSTRRCIEMAQVYERRVPLTAPVGSRRVVDGDTGAVLLGPDKLQR
jgi:hypothetical protein